MQILEEKLLRPMIPLNEHINNKIKFPLSRHLTVTGFLVKMTFEEIKRSKCTS